MSTLAEAVPPIVAVASDVSQTILKAAGIRIRILPAVFIEGLASSSVIVIVDISVAESPTSNCWFAALDMVGFEALTTMFPLVPLAAPVVAIKAVISVAASFT